MCDSGICYITDDVIESEEESDLRGGKTSHHSVFLLVVDPFGVSVMSNRGADPCQ